MPVNMDPKKRRKKSAPKEIQQGDRPEAQAKAKAASDQQPPSKPKTDKLEETTERDRELALADAEWKNLWDATEVIDMDKW